MVVGHAVAETDIARLEFLGISVAGYHQASYGGQYGCGDDSLELHVFVSLVF